MKFFDLLAHNFNRLMNIPVGHFGSSRKSDKPGPGKARAAARLAAHRADQAERLKDATEPLFPSRQQRRAEERYQKRRFSLTASQQAHINMTGEMPTYSRKTFVNGF